MHPTVKVWRVVQVLLLGVSAATMVHCQGEQLESGSALKIRDGAAVGTDAPGPERVSTVGLKGTSKGGQFICSAALIEPDVLLTAAHCTKGGARLTAFFGLNMTAMPLPAALIPASSIVIDPEYSQVTKGLAPHDIAIVKLARPAPAPFVPVPLIPVDEEIPQPSLVRLAGFGITEYGDDLGILRTVESTYTGTDEQGRLSIDDPYQRGACSGDSGGPAFANLDGTWYLAGVLSGGLIPCRGVNSYTSVQRHRKFIAEALARWAATSDDLK